MLHLRNVAQIATRYSMATPRPVPTETSGRGRPCGCVPTGTDGARTVGGATLAAGWTACLLSQGIQQDLRRMQRLAVCRILDLATA